jgi:AraC-like DNA-binding protein
MRVIRWRWNLPRLCFIRNFHERKQMAILSGSSETAMLDMARESMIERIGRISHGKSDCESGIGGLMFFRREAPMPPTTCLVGPSIVLVVQGEKQMLAGGQAYPYNIDRFLVTSLDIPANSQIVTASPAQPCLGLSFKLDLRTIAELVAQGGLPLPAASPDDRGIAIGLGTVTPALMDPVRRLVELLDEPAAIATLAPLISREIHYRLLQTDQAARLWQIASVGSQGHRVARAIDWLKANYSSTLRVDELAADVQMSPSSLHHYFRQLTGMSPLQYQKWLRLNEARRLMLNEDQDAASAAFTVGYESPSQFSREYSRLFGAPPRRDIEGLRGAAPKAGILPG